MDPGTETQQRHQGPSKQGNHRQATQVVHWCILTIFFWWNDEIFGWDTNYKILL